LLAGVAQSASVFGTVILFHDLGRRLGGRPPEQSEYKQKVTHWAEISSEP
jgi:hypothetical protein